MRTHPTANEYLSARALHLMHFPSQLEIALQNFPIEATQLITLLIKEPKRLLTIFKSMGDLIRFLHSCQQQLSSSLQLDLLTSALSLPTLRNGMWKSRYEVVLAGATFPDLKSWWISFWVNHLQDFDREINNFPRLLNLMSLFEKEQALIVEIVVNSPRRLRRLIRSSKQLEDLREILQVSSPILTAPTLEEAFQAQARHIDQLHIRRAARILAQAHRTHHPDFRLLPQDILGCIAGHCASRGAFTRTEQIVWGFQYLEEQRHENPQMSCVVLAERNQLDLVYPGEQRCLPDNS